MLPGSADRNFLGSACRPGPGAGRPPTSQMPSGIVGGGGGHTEGNGCAERFIRTLEENLLRVRSFASVEELRRALLAFRETYDATWLIGRPGFRPPAAIREEQLSAVALAA